MRPLPLLPLSPAHGCRAPRATRRDPSTCAGVPVQLNSRNLATTSVDRLLHQAHICQTTGDSVRLFQALTGKGVTPLT